MKLRRSCLLLLVFLFLGFGESHVRSHTKRSMTHFSKKRVCTMEKLTGRKYTHCPTHWPGDPLEWPCIRFEDLCNGNHDCPGGEDEDDDLCMFYKAQSASLQQIRKKMAVLMRPFLPSQPPVKHELEFERTD